MSSGAPPGPVGSGRPVIVTEGLLDSREEVTRAVSDVESRPSEVQSDVATSGSVLRGKKSVAVVSKSVGIDGTFREAGNLSGQNVCLDGEFHVQV